jgi:CheY-like chemotaxis protein
MSILVVDDDDAIRLVISTLLTEEGYLVTEAVNGQAALTQLHSSTPLPCVILLDLMMPVMNGWEFLRMRQTDPVVQRIPVVAISASRGIADSVATLNVQEALAKPIDLDRLLATVQHYCPSAPPL